MPFCGSFVFRFRGQVSDVDEVMLPLFLRHGGRAATACPFSDCFISVSRGAAATTASICLKKQQRPAKTLGLCTFSTTNTVPDNPLSTIVDATEALGVFSQELRDISVAINKKIVLPSGQSATIKDIAMHSRDADQAAFESPAAISARSSVLPVAESIETSLKEAAHSYQSRIQPQMDFANKVCRDTPCGGASWEVDFDAIKNEKEQVRVEQEDTPCGRLQKASLDFIQLTFETRFDMAIGCRAAVLIRLASKFGAPLTVIRQEGNEEDRKEMNRVFVQEKVATPWVRSEEEYKEYFRIRDEIAATENKK